MKSLFKEEMGEIKTYIEEEIEALFRLVKSPQEVVLESMRYSMTAGGKRIRPILALKTYEIVSGKSYREIMKFAVAIEMIHTYSLVHDDLPAMDNDDYRRGKPTNHRVYGEDMAILAGDGLLNLAYETMFELIAEAEEKEKYTAASLEVARASGVNGMIGGQVVDILSERKDMDSATLDYIHKNKTSRLIESSIISGAILGGASKEEMDALKLYAESIGLMFQIRDDILDRIGSSEELGKTAGIDEINDKMTYVTVHGLEKSLEKADELCKTARETLGRMKDKNTEFLEGLVDYLVCRKA